MNQEKLKEVLKDEAFVKQMLATERPEDVQAALEERGVEVTLDEIKQLGQIIAKVQKGEITQEQLQRAANGELSEAELEEVSGGFLIGFTLLVLGIGIPVAGTAAGIAHAIITRW